MRRFDFPNNVDTTKIIDSLRLGPSIHPFPLPSPLPRPTCRFSRPSLIPQIATHCNRGCTKSLWSCRKPTSCAGGPLANRQAICTQRATDKSAGDAPITTSSLHPFYPLFTPFLPCFHPDGTYQPFLPRSGG